MALVLFRQSKNVRRSGIAAALSVALFLSPQAFACSMLMGPLTRYSEEPVTIKIADTYFEIPEKLIAYGSPPAEVESIELYLEVPPDQCQIHLMSRSLARSRNYPENEVPNLTKDTNFLPFAPCWKNEAVPKYLLTIASNEPPATWEDDLKLWANLTGPSINGENACGQLQDYSAGAIVTNLFEHLAHWISTKVTYTEANVLTGLQHRNVVFRQRAMQIVTSEGFKSDRIKVALVKIAQSDIDLDLRSEATQILGSLSVDDKLVISTLRELAKNTSSKQGQTRAVLELAKVDPDFVEFIVPLIPSAAPELTRAISSGLARVVEVDYQKNRPTSYDQFSSNSKRAIQAEMQMLFAGKDLATQYYILKNFQSYKRLIITPEYIALLNELALHNDLKMIEMAVNALESLGLKPDNTPQVISHLEEFLNLSYRNIYVKPMASKIIKTLQEPLVMDNEKSKNTAADDATKLRQIEWESYEEDKNYWLKRE
ncbi:MAG: hypothetical protein JNM12_13430 [Alphaproteobacteria bacterium]|nr:hypothetical protein [Alphaproteobacteria bacterium]